MAWTYDLRTRLHIQRRWPSPAPETVLGTSHSGGRRTGWTPSAPMCLDRLAQDRPETAQYILAASWRLHFVADNPARRDLGRRRWSVWRDNQGDLPQVYSRAGHPPGASRHLAAVKVRQPFDLLVAGFRALGVTGDQITALEHPLNARNRPLTDGSALERRQNGPTAGRRG